jgi:hypothetical protein
MTEDFNKLTKKELIEKCEIAKENYTELFKENIKLTMFYSQLMNFLYKETRVLDISTEIKYKVVENEKYLEMERSLN